MVDDLRTNGRRPRLVQYVHATLRAALEHAVREELIARNVARLVKVPRAQRAEREAPLQHCLSNSLQDTGSIAEP